MILYVLENVPKYYIFFQVSENLQLSKIMHICLLIVGRDFGGVMTMQRRLNGFERDMAAIQSKLDQLESEASKLEKEHPDEVQDIHDKVGQINSV